MIDMLGTQCSACGKGAYLETRHTDDTFGVLHCNHCDRSRPRWDKKDTPAKRVPPEHSYCPHCGHVVVVPLPVEPLYLLADVAAMIPTTVPGLRAFLYQDDRGRALDTHLKRFGPRTYRYFTASQVRYIRSTVVATKRPARRPGQDEPTERHQP